MYLLVEPVVTNPANERPGAQRRMTITRSQISPLVLALVLLLIFTVLIQGASSRNMREDEGIAIQGTAQSIPATIARQIGDVHGPLYFVSFYLWQQLVGRHEFTARMFSLLTSMLTVSMLYLIGRRSSTWTGLAAMLALGFSSYFFIYSVEIRPYAQLMLLAAASMWFFIRWLDERTWRRARIYGVTVALILYEHYLGAFLILIQGIYFLVHRKPDWRLWKQAVGAILLAFCLWLPWFPIFVYQVRAVGRLVNPALTRIPGLGMAGTTLPTNAVTLNRLIMLASNSQPVVIALVMLIGLVLLWRRRVYWLAAAWGIGLPVVMLLVNLIVPVYEPRYASDLLPGLALLIGLSLTAIPGRWKVAAIGAFALVALFTVRSAVGNPTPLRDYLREFDAAYRPGDGVYLDNITLDDIATSLYTEYAPSAWPHLQHIGSLESLKSMQLPRCVWHVTADWFNPVVRDHFNYMVSTHPLQQVIGDQRYVFQQLCAPPEVQAHQFGDAMIFRGADIESSTTKQIVLKMWWVVSKAPAYDYSIGIYLLDGSGATVAQHDGPITDYWIRNTLQTSWLLPGNIYIDHVVMSLPADLHTGQYQLALKVYQSWDMKDLPLDGSPDSLLVFDKVTI